MKPFIEKITKGSEASFIVKQNIAQHYVFSWHIHNEYELTKIVKSSGRRFVGDSIAEFEEGDLVLLGPNLPHTWYTDLSDKKSYQNGCQAIVIQFNENFLGDQFWETPECTKIFKMLKKSARGILFNQQAHKVTNSLFDKIVKSNPIERLLLLLEILHKLADINQIEILSSGIYTSFTNEATQNRMDQIFNYTHDNFLTPSLNQGEMAKKVFMSESNFCHFFKKATGKTFIEYIQELRIGFACKKLIETDEPIIDICFQCGFGNLSNFNRIFLRLKKCTPKEFRKSFTR